MSYNTDINDEIDDSSEEPEEAPSRRIHPKQVIVITVVVLILTCLVSVLIYKIFTAGNEVAVSETPAPPAAATQEATEAALPAASTEEATPIPTRVISEQPTVELTQSPPVESTEPPPPTPQPTATLMPTPTRSTTVMTGMAVTTTTLQPGPVENLLKNGDFEQGFDSQGVALGWRPFKNDSLQVIYGAEAFPYVDSGSTAQRITLVGATQPNRYGGIYQQVEVVPSQVYTLFLRGQVRSGPGDINKSSYGYRMQYAVNYAGLTNWQTVPEADWVELPWDEQPLYTGQPKFYTYTTSLKPISNTVTLFVRGWNKWPDQSEAQYTLDNFSLIGPSITTGTVVIAAVGGTTTLPPTPMPGEQINKPLPVTGQGDEASMIYDGRFWGGLLILLLLAVGAVSRSKWSY